MKRTISLKLTKYTILTQQNLSAVTGETMQCTVCLWFEIEAKVITLRQYKLNFHRECIGGALYTTTCDSFQFD